MQRDSLPVIRIYIGLALLAALASSAAANGRAPGTSTISFRDGHDNDIAVGVTFGLLLSHDGGASWQWVCEAAIGYGGMYDPVYRYAASGTLFATTFHGLRKTHDNCDYASLASGSAFASTDAVGSDGAYYYGETTAAASRIFKSTDDGVTFGSGITPPNGIPNDWWQSIKVAPSDPRRVYASGYRFGANGAKLFLLEVSSDGAKTFKPASTTAFETSRDSVIDVAGVDASTPDVVYAHVTRQDGREQHGLYRSRDAGAHWTLLFTVSDPAFAFLARHDGDLIVGTQLAGTSISHDHGATWTRIPDAPHINCLAENAAGEIWACTQNYGAKDGAPSDHAGVMKSTDATHWTPVLRYQDISRPVSCAAGTVQHDTCEAQTWCGLVAQLGLTSTELACPVAERAPAKNVPVLQPRRSEGCCDSGGAGAGRSVTLLLGVALALRRRRRYS